MSVSVVIPSLNEENCIAATIRRLRSRDRYHEIIVVDGGSTDRTIELAGEADSVLKGPRGRAAQMNLGAERATGDVLFFLHADCVPDSGSCHKIQRVLNQRGVVAGCFQMRVGAAGFLYRAIDFCATARTRSCGVIYGDQGMFLKRALFQRMGGFPDVRLMEDVLFSLRLRRHGRVKVLPRRLHVSPRRWQKMGIIRQTLRNWALTALVALGVHPNRLAGLYPNVRESS